MNGSSTNARGVTMRIVSRINARVLRCATLPISLCALLASCSRGFAFAQPNEVDAGQTNCAINELRCDDVCVPNDATHCGSCENACARGTRCVSSTCIG